MKDLPSKIKPLGAPKDLAKGAFLFLAEDAARGFYYVRSGEIRIFKLDVHGRELEVARLSGGDFLGEAIAFVSGRFPFFAQAVQDSGVLYFDRDAVFRALASDSATARFFIELLARKCVTLSERVESLGLRTVRQRLIQYLLAHCRGSARCDIELPIKKGELARLLGTINATLSRSLKQLQNEGLIEVHGQAIRILACARLREGLDA